MSFISYAQNFEDVMLWRALKHIEHGFYIDVGAAWPEEHSVTKAFYDRGWHGVNIEPNPQFAELYPLARPRDINLQVAVAEAEGEADISFVLDTGLSSLDDSVVRQHERLGLSSVTKQVRVTTMARIFQQYVKEQEVHFLKVDVEGLEEKVLKGNDWSRFRPWVVVAEATIPMTQTENYNDWEPILVDAGYRHVYADGINRFYIANEHAELVSAFQYPPNVFDGFKLVDQVTAEKRAAIAEEHVWAIENSRSWRYTRHFRMMGKLLRNLRDWLRT